MISFPLTFNGLGDIRTDYTEVENHYKSTSKVPERREVEVLFKLV